MDCRAYSSAARVTSTDWASYPILTFSDLPKLEIELIDRPDAPPLGAGEAAAALAAHSQRLEDVADREPDAALGNGGLGRLAACFLDSLATMDIPAIGYGIHYEFGLFRQTFVQGRQVEVADNWLANNNPWLIRRPNFRVSVPLYGRVKHSTDDRGNHCAELVETRNLLGVPWDIPIAGFAGSSVNFLRLWESKAASEFDFRAFDRGAHESRRFAAANQDVTGTAIAVNRLVAVLMPAGGVFVQKSAPTLARGAMFAGVRRLVLLTPHAGCIHQALALC